MEIRKSNDKGSPGAKREELITIINEELNQKSNSSLNPLVHRSSRTHQREQSESPLRDKEVPLEPQTNTETEAKPNSSIAGGIKIQHNYMQNSAQGRARSTIRTGQQKERKDIDEILKGVIRQKESERQKSSSKHEGGGKDEEDKDQLYYKYNYFKNDLSFLEPQKPVNLPDIKMTKQQQQTNIEQSMKQQSVWNNSNFGGVDKSGQRMPHPSSGKARENIKSNLAPSSGNPQQTFQFNYFSDRQQKAGNLGSKLPGAQKEDPKNGTQSNFNQFNSGTPQQNPKESAPGFTRFTPSREGMYGQQPTQANPKPANPPPSKYTNIKEEKAKVTKLLEEFERKQKVEKELRMQQRQANLENNEVIFKSGAKEPLLESQTPEQIDYTKELLKVKPWLSCLPLRASKLEFLKRSFPINEETSSQILTLEGKDLEDFKNEVEFVNNEVVAKRNMLREKKNDFELLMDARYFNKYGDYLFKRLETKNHYARLEIARDASKTDIKKAYFKLALIWHPDNIKKKFKWGFAHEQAFTRLVAEIFVLFEDSYKTLTNDETRQTYDLKGGHYKPQQYK